MDMDLRENYYALLVGIITGLPAEKAFAAIERAKRKYIKLTAEQMEQTREMTAMRETGATYKEVAEEFSMPLSTVYNRIRRYKDG